MAFLDELGSKLTLAGQKTMKKANEIGDTAKINMRTNDLNRANQELYTKLGKAYYDAHKDAPEEALGEICSEITANFDEIGRLRLEIQRIKRIKVCTACGAENPSDARFCSRCSAPLPDYPPQPEAPAGRVCPSCGNPVGEKALFCTKCGTRLPPPEEPPAPEEYAAQWGYAGPEEPAPAGEADKAAEVPDEPPAPPEG